jgi:hypothetical protein
MAKKMKKTLRPTDGRLLEIVDDACEAYIGDVTILETAIGALVVGRLFGWHCLRLIHPASFKKYERILLIKFRDELPERGPFADKVNAMKMFDQATAFWRVAKAGLDDLTTARQKVVA